jgi:hypothetical protein
LALREISRLSTHLRKRCIRQHWTETNPESDTVEITTMHVIVTPYLLALAIRESEPSASRS